MTKFIFSSLIFAALPIAFAAFGVNAQTVSQANDGEQTERPARPNLLRELDLTPDQIQQVRRINRERRQVTQESQQRLKAANQALDNAIYSNASEAEIQARQKEVQAAHAEFIKNRTINEQSIKQVLTPQQFEKFRNLQADYRETKRQNKTAGENQANKPNKNQGNTLNQNSDKTLTPRQQKRQNRIERREMRQSQRKP
ncbi:MAG: Spy/CpxP family protein refolding chaperone [Pyrinomonadaceae bacterium]